jgi:hypothetical protein
VAHHLLFADLLADGIFLLIKCLLFLLGDMAAVLRGHGTLFLTNLAIVLVQGLRLALGQVPFLDFLVNALVLVVQSLVHFMAARMILGLLRFPKRAGGHAANHKGSDCDEDATACKVHGDTS